MAECPHCSAQIDKLEGFVPQSKMTERLNAKTTEIATLKHALSSAKKDAGDVGTIRTERDELKSKLTQLEQASVIDKAYQASGIGDDEKVRAGFRAVYDSQMAGVDEPTTFEEWLGSDDAKGHPLLSGHYGTPSTTTPTAPTTTFPAPTPPNANPTAAPAKMSPQQLDDYLRSDVFTRLPKEDQDKRVNELQQQLDPRFAS